MTAAAFAIADAPALALPQSAGTATAACTARTTNLDNRHEVRPSHIGAVPDSQRPKYLAKSMPTAFQLQRHTFFIVLPPIPLAWMDGSVRKTFTPQ
jgi:hypothetical protein